MIVFVERFDQRDNCSLESNFSVVLSGIVTNQNTPNAKCAATEAPICPLQIVIYYTSESIDSVSVCTSVSYMWKRKILYMLSVSSWARSLLFQPIGRFATASVFICFFCDKAKTRFVLFVFRLIRFIFAISPINWIHRNFYHNISSSGNIFKATIWFLAMIYLFRFRTVSFFRQNKI